MDFPNPPTTDGMGREQTYADRLLCLSLDIGEAILESGGEVHRVEDTITHLCDRSLILLYKPVQLTTGEILSAIQPALHFLGIGIVGIDLQCLGNQLRLTIAVIAFYLPVPVMISDCTADTAKAKAHQRTASACLDDLTERILPGSVF